jgi:hypothetical protein
MKKVIRLTESDLTRIVKRVIKENENDEYLEKIKMLVDAEHFDTALQMGETLGLKEKVEELIFIHQVTERDIIDLVAELFSYRVLSWEDPKTDIEISNYIESNPDLKSILDRTDPNSRQDKYDEIYSEVVKSIEKNYFDKFNQG